MYWIKVKSLMDRKATLAHMENGKIIYRVVDAFSEAKIDFDNYEDFASLKKQIEDVAELNTWRILEFSQGKIIEKQENLKKKKIKAK